MTYLPVCPNCGANGYQPCTCQFFRVPPPPVFYPPGCICPPTSEKTCQSPTCPRKASGLSATSAISPTRNPEAQEDRG